MPKISSRRSIGVSLMLAMLLVCNACVTQKLWHHDPEVRAVKRTAQAAHIYAACADGDCREAELLLPYRLTDEPAAHSEGFPPQENGVVRVAGGSCPSAIRQGLDTLADLPAPLPPDAILHAVIRRLDRAGRHRGYQFSLEVRSRSPLAPEVVALVRQHGDRFRYEAVRQARFDRDGRPLAMGTTLVSLGPQDCLHVDDSAPIHLRFDAPPEVGDDGVDGRPLSAKWPSADLRLLFVNEIETTSYRRPALQRYLLTPFALAADVVLVPVALLTAPLWIPK